MRRIFVIVVLAMLTSFVLFGCVNETKSFSVTWKNFDGVVLETDTDVLIGTTPTYDGSIPLKPGNSNYNYVFSGWDPVISPVESDQEYVAQFTENINQYTVTFINWDGSVISSQQVDYGSSAVAPENPVKPGNSNHNYVFSGWDPVISPVEGNQEYVAQFTENINQYTVTFINWDGSVISSQQVDYGSSAAAPENPVREGYTFDSWDQDYSNITSDLDVTATYYNKTVNYLNIATDSPWVNGAKVEVNGLDFDVDKAYLVFDVEVIQAINNDCAIMKLGVNGTAFEGPDGVWIPGDSDDVEKKWGNWFLLFPESGRNQIYIKVSDYLSGVTSINSIGIYFDTGVAERGVEMALYGIYLTDTIDHIESNNYLSFNENLSENDITNVGTSLSIIENHELVNPFNVEFKVNDEIIDTYQVEEGRYASEPENPQLEGFDFVGWYVEGTDELFDFQTAITDDLTLVAVFNVKTFEVIFKNWDDTVLSTQTVSYGESAISPDTPEKLGYTFTLWDKDYSNITSDLDVTATYEPNPYVISFEVDGGTPVTNFDVVYDQTLSQSELPSAEKSGYTFLGWGLSAEEDDLFTTIKITGNTLLYAKYATDIFTVTFDNYGVTSSIVVSQNDTITNIPNDPVYEQYNFIEWRLNDEAFDFSNPITSDMTLTAYREIKTFNVTFVDWDGSVIDSQQVDYGSSAIAPVDPHRDHYVFVGWDTDFDEVEENLVVKALYEFESTKVLAITTESPWVNGAKVEVNGLDFDVDKAYLVFDVEVIQAINNDCAIMKLGVNGTAFEGPDGVWIPGDSDDVEKKWGNWFLLFPESGRNQIYIKVSDYLSGVTSINSIGIYFDTGVAERGVEMALYGIYLTDTIDHIESNNYLSFNENLSENDITNVGTSLSIIENHELVNPFNVEFKVNDEIIDTYQVEEGKYASEPENPQLEGFDFVGWYVEGTDELFDFQTAITDDLTLVAVFNVKTFEVIFKNWDDTVLSTQTVSYGESAISPDTPEKLGYTFTLWDKDYSNITSDLDVTATYEPNPYVISFEVDGGTPVTNFDVVYDQTLSQSELPSAEKSGYTFLGWGLSAEEDDLFTTIKITGNTLLYAKYVVNTFTVTFDNYGVTSSIIVSENSTITNQPNDPVYEQYNFIEWRLNDEAFDFSNPITSDMTLTAYREIKTFSVTFKNWDDTVLSTQTVSYGESAISPDTPEKLGYTFTLWDKDYSNITSDLDVTATYEPNPYVISFEVDGGTPVTNFDVVYDQTLSQSELPSAEKSGYTFLGWGLSAEEDDLFTTIKITGNTLLYAKYVVNTFTVTFDNYGVTSSIIVSENSTITNQPNDPVYEQYNFIEWRLNDEAFDFSNPITSDMTLTAYREIKTFSVTFVDWDGSVISSQQVDYGSSAAAPENPVREGYTFDSWDQDYSNITSDLDVTATYEPNPYVISFEVDGGTPVTNFDVVYDQTLSQSELPSAEKSGYTFLGWGLSAEEDDLFTTIKITGNVLLYAKYVVNTFTVTFDNYGVTSSIIVSENSTITNQPNDPVYEQYNFIEWRLNDEAFDFSNPITSDMTLTAYREIKTFNVTFVDWDGSVISSQQVDYGSSATAPENPVREGYTFDSWDQDYSNITSDLDVTATYEPNPYVISFEVDGGTPVTNFDVVYDQTLSQSELPSAEKSGYTFLGWGLSAEEDDLFTTIKITGNTLLYAKYATDIFTVTFDNYGVTSSIIVSQNDTITNIPNDPVYEQYNFIEWRLNDEAFDFSNPITSDMTLTAYREIKTFNVTFKNWDDTVLSTQTVSYGESAISPDTPEKMGYTFTSWDKDYNNVVDNLIVMATYEPNPYVISFEVDGGTPVTNFDVVYDQTLSQSELPSAEKSGYTFLGWGLSAEEDDLFTTIKITGNTLLYAKYVVNTFTVTFDNYGVTSSIIVSENSTITNQPNDPVYEQYNFIEWRLNDEAFDFSNPITSDMTLTAYREIKTFSVTFVDWDGSVISSQQVDYGSSAAAPENPVREGYTFDSWDQDYSNITSDLDVTATYEPNPYVISFEVDGGTPVTNFDVVYDQTLSQSELPSAEKSGYTFLGWGLSAEEDDLFTTIKITGNTLLYAKYVVNTFTVTFDNYGVTSSIIVSENSTITNQPNDPVYEQYNFIEWRLNDEAFDFSNPITSDMTLTAYREIKTFSVTFVDWDGSVISSQQVDYGSSAAAPENPVREGYTFDSWDQDYSNITSDLDVTATYEPNPYVISFEVDGGTPVTNFDVVYDQTLSQSELPSAEKSGYTFLGWGLSAEEDDLFTTIKITGNVLLYAKYVVNTFTVTFDNYGVTSSIIVSENSTITNQPNDPVYEQYNFIEWRLNDEAFDFSNPITSDMTLTAYREIKTFSVTFVDWDGSVISSQQVDYGSSATAPENPVREGYTFDSWDQDYSNITSDLDVTATYVVNTFTVTFDNYGIISSIIVSENSTITNQPNDPVYEQYNFIEWRLNDEAFDFSNPITSDMTLTAYREIKTFSVTFVDWDGSVISSQQVDYGSSAAAPENPVREGYTFDSWDQDYSNITSDLDVTATYYNKTVNYLNIVTDSPWVNGAKVEVNGLDFDVDKAYLVFDVEVIQAINNDCAIMKLGVNGTAFEGPDGVWIPGDSDDVEKKWGNWFLLFPESGRNQIYIKVSDYLSGVTSINSIGIYFDTGVAERGVEMALYGIYLTDTIDHIESNNYLSFNENLSENDITNVGTSLSIIENHELVNPFNVEFKVNDEIIDTYQVEEGRYASEPENPQLEGFDFVGWYVEGTDELFDFQTAITDDLTLVAVFNVKTFEVIFKNWDDTVLSTQTVSYGESAISPDTPEKLGYTFTLWDKDYSNITSDLDVTATYEPNPYVISFEVDGGTPVTNFDVVYDQTLSQSELPSAEKSGYTFLGWGLSAEEDDLFTTIKITGNTLLYAKYATDIFTVTFDNYGVTSSIVVSQNDTITNIPNDPVYEQYNFIEWRLNDEAFDFSNPITSDMTLTAYREIKTFSVTFVDWDDTLIEEQNNIAWGTPAIAPVDPHRDHYVFVGWDTNFDEVEENLVVKALYEFESTKVLAITTESPWVSEAKTEVDLIETAVDKAFLAIDIEVIQSINSPEVVLHFGVNGSQFTGADGVLIPGNPINVVKQWGNWFFLPEGRTTLYIDVNEYLNDVEVLNFLGLYFDTGVSGRGAVINLWGVYLVDEINALGEENLLVKSIDSSVSVGSTVELETYEFVIEDIYTVNGYYLNVETDSPWATNADIVIELTETTVNKAYLAVDLEVAYTGGSDILAVMHMGVNGTQFMGPDDVLIPGSPYGVDKKWGNWFFVPHGRTTLYISVADYLSNVETLSEFGIYFDTGVPEKAGSIVNVYGIYLVDVINEVNATNLIDFSSITVEEDNVVNDDAILSNGVLVRNIYYSNEVIDGYWQKIE